MPKITVITRKAYGGAYCVMGSKHLRTDVNLAWPTAEIAVMGAEGAVNIVYRRELRRGGIAEAAGSRAPQAKTEEFRERFASPFVAAEHGFIDDVIEPRQTRPRVIRALRMLETKWIRCRGRNTEIFRCSSATAPLAFRCAAFTGAGRRADGVIPMLLRQAVLDAHHFEMIHFDTSFTGPSDLSPCACSSSARCRPW